MLNDREAVTLSSVEGSRCSAGFFATLRMTYMKHKPFNIVIVGIGGQGLITLLKILAEAALIEGFDVKTSELHGLSQRGGSVEVHIRIGKKVYSPLVPIAKADLILGLDNQEALNARYYANPKTSFLINAPEAIDASKICEEKLGNKIVAGVYLLSLAAFKNLIPIKPKSILKAIERVVKPKYLDINKKAFDLAKND